MASITKLRHHSVYPVALPIAAAGVAVLVAALVSIAASGESPITLAGIAALLVATAFAEAFPVPLEPAGEVSLAAVFIAGAALLYGWEAAVAVAAVSVVLVDALAGRKPIQIACNGSSYGLAGAAAGGAAEVASHGSHVAILILTTIAAASAFYVANMVLTTAVIARVTGQPFVSLLRSHASASAIPFAIMASVSLMLAVLWRESPFLIAALVGPLLAVALYQRSMHRAMDAMRLALTDTQTGLGNKRHFEELLQRYLDRSDEEATPTSLCLIDLDNFKQINDTYGHPIGDKVLSAVAARLRRGGESFRLGGDEFAIVLHGKTLEEARAVAETVARRIVDARYDHGAGVSISVGVASYPTEGVDRNDLVRVADTALYSAKGHGKARVHVYRPDVRMPPTPRATPALGDLAGVRAAAAAAHAVVARDVHIGTHSHNVGDLAARLGHRLGLESEQVELLRIAGNLHDIGKLLIPEEILHKPAELSAAERIVAERHSEIGFRMLDSLGTDPVATWVLHHHERWDGGGYPGGLAAEDIPQASRILFVADVYDTITTDRVYREKVSRAEALDEIERCAGTQFDPAVVAALREEIAGTPLQLVLPATA